MLGHFAKGDKMVKVICIEGAHIDEETWEGFSIARCYEYLVEGQYDFEEFDFTDCKVIQAVERVEGENYIFICKK